MLVAVTDVRHRRRAAAHSLLLPARRRGGRAGFTAVAVVCVLAVAAAGWFVLRTRPDRGSVALVAQNPLDAAEASLRSAAASPPASGPALAPAPTGTATATPSVSASPVVAGAGLTADDRVAGLLSGRIPQRGTGRLSIVPGSVPAPGRGTVHRVRVEVEGGLDIDPQAFAAFVMSTLNDPRSWGHGGRMTFARTSGAADIRVVLASPQTSAAMCAPLRTMGTLSCGQGSTAVLTLYRWVRAIPDYGTDRTGYRHYVVNHEVGHTLGHGHQMCPGRGRVAPVMMQQTKGLLGCLPNPWPYP